jgi:hypothetical protein
MAEFRRILPTFAPAFTSGDPPGRATAARDHRRRPIGITLTVSTGLRVRPVTRRWRGLASRKRKASRPATPTFVRAAGAIGELASPLTTHEVARPGHRQPRRLAWLFRCRSLLPDRCAVDGSSVSDTSQSDPHARQHHDRRTVVPRTVLSRWTEPRAWHRGHSGSCLIRSRTLSTPAGSTGSVPPSLSSTEAGNSFCFKDLTNVAADRAPDGLPLVRTYRTQQRVSSIGCDIPVV